MEFDKQKTTLTESIETQEALNKLKQKKQHFIFICAIIIVVGTILSIVFMKSFLSNFKFIHLLLSLGIVALVVAVIPKLKNYMLLPYQKLLEEAKHNDKIRHEERVRFFERKRLEMQNELQTTSINLAAHMRQEEKQKQEIEQELKTLNKNKNLNNN